MRQSSSIGSTLRFAAFLAAALTCCGVARAQVADDDPRVRATASVAGRAIAAVPGDYCLTITRDGRTTGTGCLDGAVAVRRLRALRLGPRHVVDVRPEAAASRVTAEFGRPGRRARDLPVPLGRVAARERSGGEWRVRLPRRARRATYLRLHVQYGRPTQWADFYVGMRFPRRCP